MVVLRPFTGQDSGMASWTVHLEQEQIGTVYQYGHNNYRACLLGHSPITEKFLSREAAARTIEERHEVRNIM